MNTRKVVVGHWQFWSDNCRGSAGTRAEATSMVGLQAAEAV